MMTSEISLSLQKNTSHSYTELQISLYNPNWPFSQEIRKIIYTLIIELERVECLLINGKFKGTNMNYEYLKLT